MLFNGIGFLFIKFGTFIMDKVITIMTQNTVIMHDFIGTDTTVYFTISIFLFYNFVISGSAVQDMQILIGLLLKISVRCFAPFFIMHLQNKQNILKNLVILKALNDLYNSFNN